MEKSIEITKEDIQILTGGVNRFFIIPRNDLLKLKIENHAYIKAETKEGKCFVKVTPRANTGKCDYEAENDICKFTISGFLNHQNAIKTHGLQKIIDAGDVVVIVQLNSGEGHVYGYDESEEIHTYKINPKVHGVSGIKWNDVSGYYLHLDGNQTQMPRPFIGVIPVNNNDGGIESIKLIEL